MPDITVPVPDTRLAEFYEFFAAWLRGSAIARADSPEVPTQDWSDTPEDLALARLLWGKLTDRAKGVFADLLDNPSGRPNGEDLAKRLGIPNGKYGIAGVLAWPGRHCTAAGRPLPIRNDEGAAGGSTYWIPEIPARLFAQARAASDSRTTED